MGLANTLHVSNESVFVPCAAQPLHTSPVQFGRQHMLALVVLRGSSEASMQPVVTCKQGGFLRSMNSLTTWTQLTRGKQIHIMPLAPLGRIVSAVINFGGSTVAVDASFLQSAPQTSQRSFEFLCTACMRSISPWLKLCGTHADERSTKQAGMLPLPHLIQAFTVHGVPRSQLTGALRRQSRLQVFRHSLTSSGTCIQAQQASTATKQSKQAQQAVPLTLAHRSMTRGL